MFLVSVSLFSFKMGKTIYSARQFNLFQRHVDSTQSRWVSYLRQCHSKTQIMKLNSALGRFIFWFTTIDLVSKTDFTFYQLTIVSCSLIGNYISSVNLPYCSAILHVYHCFFSVLLLFLICVGNCLSVLYKRCYIAHC